MKKISIILLTIFLLTGCKQVTSVIDTIINYFADIEASQLSGTENTEFIFKANTNDVIDQWVIDGAIIPLSIVRSVDNTLHYSFSSGTHTIEVLTTNGATDLIEIYVSPVETIFKLSGYTRDVTTEFYLDYPILTIEGIEYNLDTTENLDITETETQRIISIIIEVDFEDSFLFINNNAFNIHDIDLQNMSIADINKMILLLFPERYIEPEPEIPFYSETRFSLSGYGGSSEDVSDYLTVSEDNITITGTVNFYEDMDKVYMDDIRKIMIDMTIDNKDSFMFINNNMYEFFGIDFTDMSYNELVIAADILNRYPEETLWELQAEYNP